MDIGWLEANRWFAGRLMAFSGIEGRTCYCGGMVVATSGRCVGLGLKLPEKGLVVFDLEHCRSSVGGDFFRVSGRKCRGGNCEVRGVFVDTYHLLLEDAGGVVELEQEGDSYVLKRSGDMVLIGVSKYFDAALLERDFQKIYSGYQNWLKELPLPQTSDHMRNRAIARAACLMKTQVCTPEGRIKKKWTTPERWPHRNMWLWDSAFHSVGLRHIDKNLSREILEAMLDLVHEDGFLAHVGTPECVSEITQPPVLTIAASLLAEGEGGDEWLKKIYPSLAAYVQWDLDNRDTDGDGLVEWFIEEDENCRSGESGMDNSTRFDEALQLGAVDFNSFLCQESALLAGIAQNLGDVAGAKKWEAESSRLVGLISEKLYDPESKFFYDFNGATGELSKVMASSGFLPLLCDIPQDQVEGLCEHLQNPETFATPFPLPSIVEKPQKHSTDMWRGPAWICINWLVAEALEEKGRDELANIIRRKTMEEIERWFYTYGVFFEYYDDLGVCPPPRLMRKNKTPEEDDYDCHPHQAIKDFGWSATLYLDMAVRFS